MHAITLPEPPSGRPMLMAIDGLSGAGKSTLARAIAGGLPDATVVPGDDFYAETYAPRDAADVILSGVKSVGTSGRPTFILPT